MRMFALSLMLAVLPALPCIAAEPGTFVGEYGVAEGPDVGGGLLIREDGRFQYRLAAGALDEWAEGRWERRGNSICLTTEPRPVAPAMKKGSQVEVDGATPTLLVTWPNGRGIPGVDFRIGFDTGDQIQGYTQEDGWTMPDDDERIPRWVELREPIYNITAPRYDLADADGGRLRVIIEPNDLGVVAFDASCAERTERGITLHRAEGDMRFVRLDVE